MSWKFRSVPGNLRGVCIERGTWETHELSSIAEVLCAVLPAEALYSKLRAAAKEEPSKAVDFSDLFL